MSNIDPHYELEKKRYKNPISSRLHLSNLLLDSKGGITFNSILKKVSIKKSDIDRCDALKNRLHAMIRDCEIVLENDKYLHPDNCKEKLEGIVQFSRKGMLDVNCSGKLYPLLKSKYLDSVFPKDRVLVVITNNKALIVKIINESEYRFTGVLEQDDIGWAVLCYNGPLQGKLVLISDKDAVSSYKPGVFVSSTLLRNVDDTYYYCRVDEFIEHGGILNQAISRAVLEFDISSSFSEEILSNVSKFTEPTFESKDSDRDDLTDLDFVTIDGRSARDYDDAVCVQKLDKGYAVWVAIADVSYYVAPDSDLDIVARSRSTSVYFPGKVLPMLPEILSDNLCSLLPGVLRNVLYIKFIMDDKASVLHYSLGRGIIKSKARLTYEQVDISAVPVNLLSSIKSMKQLFYLLLEQRNARNVLDIEIDSTNVLVDDFGEVVNIESCRRLDSHQLIEELMLLANNYVAKYCCENKLPVLYRCHQEPLLEKLENFRMQLISFGKKVPKQIDNIYIQSVLDQFDGVAKVVLSFIVLRCMSQAKYLSRSDPHWGLQYDKYLHFTSPIRRYPDLFVHQVLSKHFSGKKMRDENLDILAENCSNLERRAESAERLVQQILKCDYANILLGNRYNAVISGFSKYAIFVYIADIGVDACIRLSSLQDDYYEFNEKNQYMESRSGKKYLLCQQVVVEILDICMINSTISVSLLD